MTEEEYGPYDELSDAIKALSRLSRIELTTCQRMGHRYDQDSATVTGPDLHDRYERRIPCEGCRHRNPDGTPGDPRVVRIEVWEIHSTPVKITTHYWHEDA